MKNYSETVIDSIFKILNSRESHNKYYDIKLKKLSIRSLSYEEQGLISVI